MRKAMGVSQEKFAMMAKLDRSYYGRIERGGQNMALSTLVAIALALRVPPAVLLADITLGDCNPDETES